MYDTMKDRRIGIPEVIEKFGVPPEKVVEVQALAGDSTDNVPGVPGIGIKTAAQLIVEYGDLEQLLFRATEIKQPKRREALIENAEKARISRQLVLLDDKVELEVPLDDLAVHEPDARKLIAFLKAMEFTTLTRRVADYSQIDPANVDADASNSSGARCRRRAAKAKTSCRASGDLFAARKRATANAAATRGQGARVSRARRFRWPPRAKRRCASFRSTAANTRRSRRSRSSTPSSRASTTPAMSRSRSGQLHRSDAGRSLRHRAGAGAERGLLRAAGAQAVRRRRRPVRRGPRAGPGQACRRDRSAAAVLESPGILKIGFDVKFTAVMLAQHGITLRNADDAQLISYVLDAGRGSHAIEALAERWFGHAMLKESELLGSGKGKITFDQVPIDKAAPLSAEGADMALRVWRVLKPRLVAEHMTAVYETLERPLVSVLARMERRGISIDRQVLSRLSGDFAQTAARVEAEIQEIAGEPVNVGSPKQIGDILFGKMGLSGGTKTKTGAWSTTAQVLDELAEQGHDLPKKILEWRQVSKLKSTYTDALPTYVNPQTHRVHTTYALAATTTGRLSSNEPNLQNIPVRTEDGRKIRRAFIATPGHKLVSADYSQIELRLLAEIADIPVLKQAFKDGLDIHAMTASEMFGVPIEGMPSEIRRRAKAINFGIIYGISAFGLANQLGIAREEASAYIKKYFERFPGIRAYMDETRDFCRSNGYVTTLFGRKMYYPDIKASNASVRAFNERAAINARLQGTAADIIRRAMTRMEDALVQKKLSAQMLLQVHDELIFEVPDAEVEATLPVVQHVMQDAPFPAVMLSVPLHVDARAANNWDEAH